MEKEETLYSFYSKYDFNPTGFSLETEKQFGIQAAKRNNLYVNKLSLPNLIWRNANVLEIGCGSGENALVQAKLGAKFTFVEPVKPLLDQTVKLFQKWQVADAINEIHISTIEDFEFHSKFDVIIAEGFIHSLRKRREVIRKLFSNLNENGLLILSTLDTAGSFLDFFKAGIAQIYCHSQGITDLDEKVEAVRSFFEFDFEHIPHSRPFSAWAKDILFNPVFNPNSFYDFPKIISDLSDLHPWYYSSWPSYKHSNDLLWHRYIPGYDTHINQVLGSYYLRRHSFILGEPLPEKDALQMLLKTDTKSITDLVPRIIGELNQIMCREKAGYDKLRGLLEQLANSSNGEIKTLAKEMLSVVNETEPAVYQECKTLRKYWGVPSHYIVLYYLQ